MIGLIMKDILVMRKLMKSYLLLIVIYIILAYLDFFDYSFIITFVQIILAVMPISAFAYDEQSKWDRYAMSLPLGRSKVVGARYLFVLALTLFTVAMGLAGTALLYLAHQVDPLEMFVTLMVSTAIGLLLPTILLPLSYKLGAERARPYLYAIVFIPVIAFVLLVKAEIIDFSALNRLNGLSPTAILGGSTLLPLAGLAGLAVSYLISCRVAAGKEY